MSEISLITVPAYLEADTTHPDLHCQRVVGIAAPQTPTITEHGYVSIPEEVERPMAFPGEISERITDFYQQTLAKEAGERPYYDCHMFAFYALGKVHKLALAKSMTVDAAWAVPDDGPLTLGEPYVTVTDNNTINHSVLGVHEPDLNLSVIGTHMPLVISGNQDIVRLYGAQKLYHATPGAVEF